MYRFHKPTIAAAFWIAGSAALIQAASPVVVSAVVNPSTQQMTIKGSDLTPATGLPVLTLDAVSLTVLTSNHKEIVATIPGGLAPGSYQLTVNNGTATVLFDVTYGADGPLTLPFAGSVSNAANPAFAVTNTSYANAAIAGHGGAATSGAGGGGSTGIIGYGGPSNGTGDGPSYGGYGLEGYGGVAAVAGDVGGYGVTAFGGTANTPTSFPGQGLGAVGGGFSGTGSVNAGDGINTFGGVGGTPNTSGNGIYSEPGIPGSGGSLSLQTNFAGLFNGDVDVEGNLSKAGGSFKIDHPLDPANKYLLHSFVESPDMKNIYDGMVVSDATGTAIVTMPAWFEALNNDFRYQLTVIGQFAQAIVASEIANRSFIIKTSKPNVKVSWQVTGIRQDAWANAHRIPVEVEKAPQDQGRYLHPELFGHEGEPNIAGARHPRPAPPQQ
jgi:hypothetical protein